MSEPSLHVVLYQPEIPPNTGNVGRLCLATQARLHLVGPLGFSLEDKHLRRAGMDYWDELDVKVWEDWEQYCLNNESASKFFLSSKSKRSYFEASFAKGDHLVFGPETRGLPESILEKHEQTSLTIPMPGGGRSLNLATSVGIVVYEALRQVDSSL